MNGSFSKPKLVQVGLVVPGPWTRPCSSSSSCSARSRTGSLKNPPRPPGPKYYLGQERDFYQRAALYSMNGIEFEILQPYNDRSALTDFLDERGRGPYTTSPSTRTTSTPLPRIWPKTAQSLFRPGQTPGTLPLKWGFFSTNDKLGTMIEVTNFQEVANIEAAEKGE